MLYRCQFSIVSQDIIICTIETYDCKGCVVFDFLGRVVYSKSGLAVLFALCFHRWNTISEYLGMFLCAVVVLPAHKESIATFRQHPRQSFLLQPRKMNLLESLKGGCCRNIVTDLLGAKITVTPHVEYRKTLTRKSSYPQLHIYKRNYICIFYIFIYRDI